ncbi:hypothetical protein [Vibrio cincinnatiensis]|uniref:hypothetical protein n=1 Tax=Vibrio cincinnatiensis TaxID=675 RepID=UPI001302B1E5|nr:hypothetical protein [Vibrio cincinnatiensis]
MQLSTLIERLKNALMDSAELISGIEQQVIELALADYSRYRPQKKLSTFSLMTGKILYPAPADLMQVRTVLYGQSQRAKNPWERGYPRSLPRLTVVEDDQDKKWLQLSHFPAESVVMSCGRDFSYIYYAARKISGDSLSIDIQDEPLLLLRCVAEAVKHIMVHQLNKTVSVRNSIGGEAKNGTPAAVHQQLMTQFIEQVKDA